MMIGGYLRVPIYLNKQSRLYFLFVINKTLLNSRFSTFSSYKCDLFIFAMIKKMKDTGREDEEGGEGGWKENNGNYFGVSISQNVLKFSISPSLIPRSAINVFLSSAVIGSPIAPLGACMLFAIAGEFC